MKWPCWYIRFFHCRQRTSSESYGFALNNQKSSISRDVPGEPEASVLWNSDNRSSEEFVPSVHAALKIPYSVMEFLFRSDIEFFLEMQSYSWNRRYLTCLHDYRLIVFFHPVDVKRPIPVICPRTKCWLSPLSGTQHSQCGRLFVPCRIDSSLMKLMWFLSCVTSGLGVFDVAFL